MARQPAIGDGGALWAIHRDGKKPKFRVQLVSTKTILKIPYTMIKDALTERDKPTGECPFPGPVCLHHHLVREDGKCCRTKHFSRRLLTALSPIQEPVEVPQRTIG